MSSYHKNKMLPSYFCLLWKSMQGNDSSCGMTTGFNISSSNTSISLAKKQKNYTIHYVILSQTHTCKNIISSYPHNASSRPFTRQSCRNISFLLAYFFRLFHLLFYWPCANTIKNFVFLKRRQWWIGRAHNKLIVWNPRKKSRGCRSYNE